jgi:type I restriction enzyme S subunit
MRSDVPDGWMTARLRDVAAQGGLIGGPFGSSLGRKDYVAEGVPVIRGANLARPPFVTNELVFVSDAKADELQRCLAVPGDIVVTQRGTLGQVGRVPNGAYRRWLISQSQMALRVDPTRADARFVYQSLRSPELQQQIRDHAIVTGVPHINLGIFRDLELPLPPLLEQQRIASVLGALDDKVDSNRRLSALLEAAAACLVESACLRSTPVTVEQVASFHNRRRIPLSAEERAARPGPFPYYGATGVLDHIDDYLFSGPHVLVGEDGSVETTGGRPVVQYAWGRFWVNNHAHVLTFGSVAPEVGYLVLRAANVAPFVTGAVQQKLSMRRLKEVPVRWPHDMAALEAPVSRLLAAFRACTEEISTLTALRDNLAPKLLSGKIRVPDTANPEDVISPAAERLVGAAR